MPEKPILPRSTWQASLDRLLTAPGVVGALLVTRDGIPVLTQYSRLRRPETFSAMAAAALSASEVIAHELGMGGPVLVRIEGPRLSVVALAASEDLMLIAIAEPGANLDVALNALRNVLPPTGP